MTEFVLTTNAEGQREEYVNLAQIKQIAATKNATQTRIVFVGDNKPTIYNDPIGKFVKGAKAEPRLPKDAKPAPEAAPVAGEEVDGGPAPTDDEGEDAGEEIQAPAPKSKKKK